MKKEDEYKLVTLKLKASVVDNFKAIAERESRSMTGQVRHWISQDKKGAR